MQSGTLVLRKYRTNYDIRGISLNYKLSILGEVRYGQSRASTKAAFNLSNEDCSVSVYIHLECDPFRPVKIAAMSA